MTQSSSDSSSSSPRGPGACDAIVTIQDRQVGVIRLPANRADDFVDQFNRTYRELGLSLEPVAGIEKKILASDQAGEDSMS